MKHVKSSNSKINNFYCVPYCTDKLQHSSTKKQSLYSSRSKKHPYYGNLNNVYFNRNFKHHLDDCEMYLNQLFLGNK